MKNVISYLTGTIIGTGKGYFSLQDKSTIWKVEYKQPVNIGSHVKVFGSLRYVNSYLTIVASRVVDS